jgi:hypothetical protein
MAALLPDPVEAAGAATSQGHDLRLPEDGHAPMRVLYKAMQRIEYDLRQAEYDALPARIATVQAKGEPAAFQVKAAEHFHA